MQLLVIRADLRDRHDYGPAARAYGEVLAPWFDRTVLVDVAATPSARPASPFPVLTEVEARDLAGRADFALVLTCAPPDAVARYRGAVNVGLCTCEADRPPRHWLYPLNGLDALWVPNAHSRRAFEAAGVVVPVRVLPCPPSQTATHTRPPVGEFYDLDRPSRLVRGLLPAARFRGGSFGPARALMRVVRPSLARTALSFLRTSPHALQQGADRLAVCLASDETRHAPRLVLAEWMEFRQRDPAAPWRLLLRTTTPATPACAFDRVVPFWEHVQALKRQLGVRRAGVSLWNGGAEEAGGSQLLRQADAVIVSSLGAGFECDMAEAVSLGKPVVGPRFLGAGAYAYPTRPAIIRLIGGPKRAHDPAAAWQVPLPGALAEALGRLATDVAQDRVARPPWPAWDAAALLERELRRLWARFGGRRHSVTPRRQPA